MFESFLPKPKGPCLFCINKNLFGKTVSQETLSPTNSRTVFLKWWTCQVFSVFSYSLILFEHSIHFKFTNGHEIGQHSWKCSFLDMYHENYSDDISPPRDQRHLLLTSVIHSLVIHRIHSTTLGHRVLWLPKTYRCLSALYSLPQLKYKNFTSDKTREISGSRGRCGEDGEG